MEVNLILPDEELPLEEELEVELPRDGELEVELSRDEEELAENSLLEDGLENAVRQSPKLEIGCRLELQPAVN